MAKIKYNFSTDPDVPDMMREMAAADSREVAPWLTLLIKRTYEEFKKKQVG